MIFRGLQILICALVFASVCTANNRTVSTETTQRIKNVLRYLKTKSVFALVQETFALFDQPRFEFNSTDSFQTCSIDLKLVSRGFVQEETWALKMIDSFGKPGSAILNYQTKWLGAYDECVSLKGPFTLQNSSQNLSAAFSGRYCKLSLYLSTSHVFLPGTTIIFVPSIELGICVPSSCSSSAVEGMLHSVIPVLDDQTSKLITGFKATCEEDKTIETSIIISICILGIIGAITTVATLYDIISSCLTTASPTTNGPSNSTEQTSVINNGFLTAVYDAEIGVAYEANNESSLKDEHVSNKIKEQPQSNQESQKNVEGYFAPNLLLKLLVSFSVYTNGKKLLSVSERNKRLSALHGIKFISMSWIILGHTFLFLLPYWENPIEYMLHEGASLTFMVIPYASIGVDSFLTVSGLLVAVLTLTEMKRVGGIRNFNWVIFFIHRLWRLTPTYMLVLMVYTTMMKHWLSGPFWTEQRYMFENCKESWWTNLLYINNFVKLDKMCMGWTWYLANDMQFYILSPLMLIPLFYNVLIGGAVCLMFLIATVVTIAAVMLEHDFNAQEVFRAVPWMDNGEYSKFVYLPCYTRIGPYVVGLFTGYLLYKQDLKYRLPKVAKLILWLISFAVCLLVVYGPYPDHGNHVFTDGQSVVYEALHRTGWGMAICWIIFSCATGGGGWIKNILSWKPFIPLGRLTYAAYLVHPLVVLTMYMNRREPIYLSTYEVIALFLANHILTYGTAVVVSLAFESPMIAVEKCLLKRNRSN